MILDVLMFMSTVDADSIDDISKVVVPNSKGEDDMCACKRCGEVHGVKNIEECRRVHREQSRCTRCGLVHIELCHHGLDH
jgi:hypothetical protein